MFFCALIRGNRVSLQRKGINNYHYHNEKESIMDVRHPHHLRHDDGVVFFGHEEERSS